MNIRVKYPTAEKSPAEVRPSDAVRSVRDFRGQTVAHLSEDWEHYVQRDQGRTGNLLVQEIGEPDGDTFEIVTFDGEAVAYIGTRADRANVMDLLFPMQEAAE